MAELGLAIAGIAGTIDVCFKYGKILIDTYESFRGAEDELNERIVRLENIWLRTSTQLQFLVSIWSSLDQVHQRLHRHTVEILASKLKVATLQVEGAVKTDKTGGLQVKRWKYALLKDRIDQAVVDLDTWQRTFDPSWFLILKLADSQVDRSLTTTGDQTLKSATSFRQAVRPKSDDKSKVFLPSDGLELTSDVPILHSDFRLVQRKGSSRWLIFETLHLPEGGDLTIFTKNIRDIARKLSHSDPLTFQLLNCYGVIKHVDARSVQSLSFTFVFRVPDGLSSPVSLRNVLLDGKQSHSLSERLQIAKDLARAVSYVHSFGFVHKNVRPETVLLLKAKDSKSQLGIPFLAGFEAIRSAEGPTKRRNDELWHLNLYRHPHRHGMNPTEDYMMQHDIYSLGVCLLEIGLFSSLIDIGNNGQAHSPSTILGTSLSANNSPEPLELKERFIAIARNDLPSITGSIFANVVINCLTCLDEDNIDFGNPDEFSDEDGILVNVKYVGKILFQLNEISV